MVQGEEHGLDAFKTFFDVYRLPIALGGVSLLCIVIALIVFIKSYERTAPIRFSSDNQQASVAGIVAEADVMTLVDVEGAVVHPGVYRMPQGSRVDDAITAAGGLSNDADNEAIATSINRAAKLSDGAKLYIPKRGQSGDTVDPTQSSQRPLSTFLHINTASQSELETLSGVGPVTAEKIIGGRPYMRLEELVEKKAMSQSLFEKLKSQLTL